MAQLRHRAEVPMLVLLGVLTVAIIVGAIVFVSTGSEISPFAQGVLAGLIAPAAAFFMIRYLYWSAISDSVEVTEKQFPELYTMYVELAEKMGFSKDGEGLKKLPRLYIKNGNGTLNAYASKCQVKRSYVVLYSDIVDIAYTYGDFDALRFILAHELGHIKCGHVSLWRSMLNPVGTALFLDKTLVRAQEYTADRAACYYAPEGKMGMINLYAGKHLAPRVDMDEYFRSVDNHKDGIWLRLSNFLSDHAVGFRRMKAIKDTETHGWNVHGRML